MADQINITAASRSDLGKGASKRLRKTGRVPAIVYGTGVEPTSVDVDALEMYHALHTPAGMNVLIRLEVEGEEHLTIVREIQRHAVRGDLMHIDFQAVNREQLIPADIPIHLENEEAPKNTGGIVNLVLHTVPIHVRPLEVPTFFTLDLAGLEIGDVKRVEDLRDQLPKDAEFDIEPERTVVTINAPTIEAEPSADEGAEAVDGEAPAAEGDAPAADAEGEG